ncbi:MAG: class I SAM-dependent methyltransferase [Acidobacteria bacterium]|nr:class I SAM-dependent methyltransferase [Acidobacteriota bacterium]
MSIACPICRTPDCIACFQGIDRLFGLARGKFSLFRCLSCACVFLDPLPEESALADYYPAEYWWSEESTSRGVIARLFHSLEKSYREFVIKDHVRFLDFCARKNGAKGKRLLDVGCGSGSFLHSAQFHGFIPHGMDVSARAVEIVKKQYGYPARQGRIGEDIWEGNRFDFITMFHVLEHLPDPRLGLKYAGDLLNPGGTLVIQVPNITSAQARFFGSRWHGIDVPRHVINYSPKALGSLLQEMGYEFQILSRFSLRDNPASIASSLAPWLDPIGRKGRLTVSAPVCNGLLETAYFGLFLLSLPVAYFESMAGLGGTLWTYARLNPRSS